MRKLFFLATILAAALTAQADILLGYQYQVNPAEPDGTEWESPERIGLNKEQPHTWFFDFANVDEARKILPDHSSYWMSLDGQWQFKWKGNPTDPDPAEWETIGVPGCWNVQGLGKHGEMKYGVPLYVNQPVMFYHEVKVGDWKEGVMRQPKDQRYTTYKYPNEVGSYRRSFTVPAAWKGRNVIINFDGVDSFFYLWINGKYVGFSKNSRNTASFDITPYLNKKGENVVAVEVYRSSDGSFLEAQDMFRLPGIFRSTYLTSTPQVKIEDLVVRTKEKISVERARELIAAAPGCKLVEDYKGNQLLLFSSMWSIQWVTERNKGLKLAFRAYDLRYAVYWIGLAALLTAVFSFIGLMSVSGRRPREEKIIPGPLYRVPTDLLFGFSAAICCPLEVIQYFV